MQNRWTSYRSPGHDELIGPDGVPREAARAVTDYLDRLDDAELERRREAASQAISQMGITFTVYSDGENIDREWPFDIVPRVIDAREWRRVEEGLKQRLEALNLFIDDLYNEQRIVADGVLPRALLDSSVNFRPECVGVRPPHGVWAHVCGSDLVRDEDGTMYVLEDNLRVPSGVSYMLENREIMKRTLPELFGRCRILPVDDYTGNLARTLASLSSRPDPVLCVLTPGVYNSAYFEHAFLAQQIGAELVEGRDLFVGEDGCVYARMVEGPKRVDVIYRRVDDAFIDPDVFRADSTLGVRGLMQAWTSGKVAIANAPGSGVADDKVVYSYVPDIIRYYLGAEPLIANVPTYRCERADERAHVLANLESLVVKPANESGGYGMLIGPHSTAAEREDCARRVTADPRNYIAQPTLGISTTPTLTDAGFAARHVDLRPFVLQGESITVTTGGLTRVALVAGSLVVNSSQGGGSKDTWIVDLEGAAASRTQSQSQGDARQTQSLGALGNATGARMTQTLGDPAKGVGMTMTQNLDGLGDGRGDGDGDGPNDEHGDGPGDGAEARSPQERRDGARASPGDAADGER